MTFNYIVALMDSGRRWKDGISRRCAHTRIYEYVYIICNKQQWFFFSKKEANVQQ